MSALELARLRASGGCTVPAGETVEQAAAAIGRSLRRAGTEAVLARHPEAPAPTDLEIVPATLPDSTLVALGLCVGIAWLDRDHHPHPGRPFTLDDVTAAARGFGITVAAGRHVIGAVRNVLVQARLLSTSDGEWFTLGPAVAGWDDADLDAFRRNHDVLPRLLEAST